MYNHYPTNAAYVYSFNEKNNDLRQKVRSETIGGLTTCLHRHVNLYDENYPKNSRFAPNGQRFTSCCFFDFNSMVNGSTYCD